MKKVYRISREKYIRDLSGIGAAIFGGRWNQKGTYVLYTAANPSLAMLEWLAHVRDREMDDVYCMATLLIPDIPFKRIEPSVLPANWRETPPPLSLQQLGGKLISDETSLGFEAPSVLMPLDFNLVLNVRHPLFLKVELVEIQRIIPDNRLIK